MTASAAAWAALVLYVVGVVLAFGVRSWLHWRATGSTGFRGITGRPGSVEWWGGVLFPAALVLGLAAPVLVLTGVTSPLTALTHPVISGVGLAIGLAGAAVTLVAQAGMGTSWRIGVDTTERTALVTTDLFRWVRNPIFTGMGAVMVGVALLTPTVVAVLALGCLVAAVQIQVRVVEEPYLHHVHGEAYAAYCAATGRFLPRLRKSAALPNRDGSV